MILYHLDNSGQIGDKSKLDLLPLSILPSEVAASPFFRAFPDGISRHCVNNMNNDMRVLELHPTSMDNFALLNMVSFDNAHSIANWKMLELIAELVRQLHFPHLPSRLTSLFAVRQVADFTVWTEMQPTEKAAIYTVDVPDNTPRFDANLLQSELRCILHEGKWLYGFLPIMSFDYAYRYWSGEQTATPRWEYLIPLPVEVQRTSYTFDDIKRIMPHVK